MITITKYKKHYKKTTIMLNDAYSQSRITLIKGANGSGKTTLLKSIAKLNHYQGNITAPYPAYYIEETAAFPDAMRVFDYLSILASLNKIPIEKCQYLLKYFAMTKHAHKYFSTLSKGMKQKINLIQTLILPSNCYLLDEPLSGLDNQTIESLVLFIKAAKSHFIIASHHPTPFLPLNPEIITL